MTPATVVGRHVLSSRYTANVRIVYMDYANLDELENTYSVYLKTILSHANFGKGEMSKSSKKVARFIVETYDQVK